MTRRSALPVWWRFKIYWNNKSVIVKFYLQSSVLCGSERSGAMEQAVEHKDRTEVVIVHCAVRLWRLQVRQCGFPPSSPRQLLLCASVTEPQSHLQWGWDTEHVSPICQTICQHSHNTPAKCGCGPLRPSASMLLQNTHCFPNLISPLSHCTASVSCSSIYLSCFKSFSNLFSVAGDF